MHWERRGMYERDTWFCRLSCQSTQGTRGQERGDHLILQGFVVTKPVSHILSLELKNVEQIYASWIRAHAVNPWLVDYVLLKWNVQFWVNNDPHENRETKYHARCSISTVTWPFDVVHSGSRTACQCHPAVSSDSGGAKELDTASQEEIAQGWTWRWCWQFFDIWV